MPYVGPATVTSNGQTYEVQADLRVTENRRHWSGRITAATPAICQEIQQDERPHLRLPDGREDTFTFMEQTMGMVTVTIFGSGPPPSLE
ncbi:DUF4873 domain-containing protein [Streptomyces sp. NPDC017991]|uniref:DUF4873 domain-containing protein n=1 Tax=Streptomyces sp. NPDC017991 TaxID=3365026 RepID=UPI00378FCD21